jgi:hypothetical protein
MLRHVLFDLDLFRTEADRANSQKRVLVLLEALTLCDQFYLEEHPNTPLIYQSGIKYKMPAQFEKEENPEIARIAEYLSTNNAPAGIKSALKTLSNQIGGGETFRDIPRILENGGGDCDNCASWRAAEIRHRLGIAAKPYITWRKRADGGTTYHVIVIWPDGSSEDPSLLLGMPKDDGGASLREEQRKLGERAGEMLNALAAPRAEKIVGEARRKAQLLDAVGLLLRGAQ